VKICFCVPSLPGEREANVAVHPSGVCEDNLSTEDFRASLAAH